MKRERIQAGHEWSDGLTLAVKDAVRSCLGGIGSDKVNLRKVKDLVEVEAVPDGPSHPSVILIAMFACSEMEAAARLVRHLSIEEDGKTCVRLLHTSAFKNWRSTEFLNSRPRPMEEEAFTACRTFELKFFTILCKNRGQLFFVPLVFQVK